MNLSSMNPDVARKLLSVGELFRIQGPFFSYEEIKMGNVNHTYKVNYIRDDGTGMAENQILSGSAASTPMRSSTPPS